MSYEFDETVTKPLDAYAWPGGYPMYYVNRGDAICPDCANQFRQDYTLAMLGLFCEWVLDPEQEDYYNWGDPNEGYWLTPEVNYEDSNLYCDQCSDQIGSAYGEDDK